LDPAEFRRKNLIADDAYPYTFPSGVKFEKLSHHKCLDLLLQIMKYQDLRQEQVPTAQERHLSWHRAGRDDRGHQPFARFSTVSGGGAASPRRTAATLRLEPTGMGDG